jgi:hypothetical protein
MPETWHARIKEAEVAEAEDVEDAVGAAVAEAVADEEVEEDRTFPHPNPKKITKDKSSGNRIHTTLRLSAGMHQLKGLLQWQQKKLLLPQAFPTQPMSSILNKMMTNDRKP